MTGEVAVISVSGGSRISLARVLHEGPSLIAEVTVYSRLVLDTRGAAATEAPPPDPPLISVVCSTQL